MKLLAALMCLSLANVSLAEPAPAPSGPGELAPVTITAPRPDSEKTRHLKQARAAGSLAAASGLGVMTYAVFFAGTGPIGWAAGLLFAGGVTAYLARRALRGHDDFSPGGRRPGRPPGAETVSRP